MKIIILTGDDTEKIDRRKLLFKKTAKRRGWEVVIIKPSGYFKTIGDFFRTSSLFNKNRLFIIEDPKIFNKNDFDWLKNEGPKIDATLVIIDPKQTLSSSLKISKIIKEEYRLPKILFTFLENLVPNNSKASIKFLHRLHKNYRVEFIFSMIINHFCQLYFVKVAPSLIPLPSWRVAKLERQSGQFTLEKLEENINALAEIDLKVKSSRHKLDSGLDFFLAKSLE